MENDETIVEGDEIPELPETVEGEDDTTDYKALAQKLQGMSKRFQTKLKKLTENPPAKPVVEQKSEGLDYGQKAYLNSLGYKDNDEQSRAEAMMKATGKRLEEVLESKYFKAEIDDMREQKKTQIASNATSNSKRSGASAKSEVDYWIAKGELPTDNVELARKVVAARRGNDSKGNPFRR
jgi:hypothetical protein